MEDKDVLIEFGHNRQVSLPSHLHQRGYTGIRNNPISKRNLLDAIIYYQRKYFSWSNRAEFADESLDFLDVLREDISLDKSSSESEIAYDDTDLREINPIEFINELEANTVGFPSNLIQRGDIGINIFPILEDEHADTDDTFQEEILPDSDKPTSSESESDGDSLELIDLGSSSDEEITILDAIADSERNFYSWHQEESEVGSTGTEVSPDGHSSSESELYSEFIEHETLPLFELSSSSEEDLISKILDDAISDSERKFITWHGQNQEESEEKKSDEDSYDDFQEEILPDSDYKSTSESDTAFHVMKSTPMPGHENDLTFPEINHISPLLSSSTSARQVAEKFAEALDENTAQGIPHDVALREIVDVIEASAEEHSHNETFCAQVLSELIDIVSEELEEDRLLENAMTESDINFLGWYEHVKPLSNLEDDEGDLSKYVLQLSFGESSSEEDRENYRDSLYNSIQRENNIKQDMMEAAENNFKQWYLPSESDVSEFESYLPRISVMKTSPQTESSTSKSQTEESDSFDEFLDQEEMPEGLFSDED